MNKFLSYYSKSLLEKIDSINIFPCDIKDNTVTYITCEELMNYPEKRLKNFLDIFDEIDRCY